MTKKKADRPRTLFAVEAGPFSSEAKSEKAKLLTRKWALGMG